VAIYIETLSDNRNRTSAEIRSLLSRNGGSLGEPGSVAWQFERKGVIVVARSVDEDELMAVALDAGAEDLTDEGDTWRITTGPSDLPDVRAALEAAGIAFESADVTMLASTSVPLSDASEARDVLRIIDALDDDDDVQGVYANFDIPDAVLQEMAPA
jgi:YebC/PmpR family DNA-binding regulatory protein